MRCDVHVHSRCSGVVNLPVLRALGRACYSEPCAVDERACRRGEDHSTPSGDSPGLGPAVNAVLAYVSRSDRRVFGQLRAWQGPRWFRLWMLWSSRLADGWIYLLLGMLLASSGTPGRRLLSAGSLGLCVANALLLVIKRRVRRPRPCDIARHLRYAVRPPDRWSFPSGHTLNAFTAGTFAALAFPAHAPLALLLAASVGASRVVLGMHFLSDVLAGALLGGLLGSAAYVVMR